MSISWCKISLTGTQVSDHCAKLPPQELECSQRLGQVEDGSSIGHPNIHISYPEPTTTHLLDPQLFKQTVAPWMAQPDGTGSNGEHGPRAGRQAGGRVAWQLPGSHTAVNATRRGCFRSGQVQGLQQQLLGLS